MGRDKEYPLSQELESNLADLLEKVNKFRTFYGQPLVVSSGYRPGKYNAAAGGAKKSLHMTCQAVDFRDKDGKLAAFCLQHLDKLKEFGLWMEDPKHTKGWVHLDVKPRRNNPFIP